MAANLRTILPLLAILKLSLAQTDFKLDKFEYRGLRNVLHNDTQNHKGIAIPGDLSTDRLLIRNSCAGYCSLDEDCDAYYLEEKDNGNCHLVDEQLPPATPRYIGHGWQLDNIYYVKHDANTLYGSISIPEEVIPPCDSDETQLSQAECTAFSAQMLTYFHCQDSSAKYTDTVDKIKDAKCPGEDRLLQCELENREVESNIADKTLFNDAFIKTGTRSTGFISDGATMTYVTMTFKGAPREITRIILRTIRSGNEKMKLGDVEIYAVGDNTPDKIEFNFSNLQTSCALHINLNHPDVTVTKHTNAEKVTVRPSTWWGFDKSGFKADVFLKEKVV